MVHPPAIPSSMLAVVLEKAGESPRLYDAERPAPDASPGHVLVRVEAAGFCHHDALIMSGVLRRGVRLPLVPGHEVAGTVVAAGDDSGEGLVGKRVVVVPGALGHRREGAFAEYVLVPSASAVPLSGDLAPGQTALLACPLAVVLKAVENVAQVQPGETVVVIGVSGGLGIHAAQVARALGANVLGVTGSAEKATRLEEIPWLSGVITAGEVPWDEVVVAMTEDRGAELVVDTGGSDVRQGVRALAHGGRLVMLGQVGRDASPLLPAEVVFREARLLGSLGAERAHVERALAMVQAGKVTPIVDRVLPLNAASVLEAHGLLRDRKVLGRIVLAPEVRL